MTKHISCDYKCKFNSTKCNSSQNWNNKTCQCEGESYCTCKKKYSWNPSICTSESSKYLKSFVDTSVIACDEFVSFMDIVSTKERNTITENVSISCYSEKKDIKLIAIFCTKFY